MGFGHQGFGGGAGDITPPTISAFTPGSGSTILKNDAIALDVTDAESGLANGGVTIYASFDDGTAELVYANGAFTSPYGSSSATPAGAGLAFAITRDATWPTAGLTIGVIAFDAAGNDSTATGTFTISNPPFSIDGTSPVVGNFSPANGSTLQKGQAITFEVTDNSGAFRRIIIHAAYPTGEVEVVYDGANFRGLYTVKSTRTLITGGFRFSVLRANAWPSAPTITVYAIDQKGNEAP